MNRIFLLLVAQGILADILVVNVLNEWMGGAVTVPVTVLRQSWIESHRGGLYDCKTWGYF